MLPLRPSFATNINVFGEIQTAHKSLGLSGTSFRGQTPKFHTPRSKQGIEAKLDEHRRVASMFQLARKYNVQMTKILLRLFDLEIKNKQIIEEKEQKLKAKLQARNSENNLKSLGFSGTSFRGQTPKFHTPRSKQGI